MKKLRIILLLGAVALPLSELAAQNTPPPVPANSNAVIAAASAPATPVPAPLLASAASPAPATPAPTPVASTVTAPATAATNAPSKNEKNIRFQFDGIPYSDVVERFAQMAGKPLLTDSLTNIAGTLTYDDSHPYNYAEAFDTLNLILAMKGVMLIEDGNYLRLVPFKQLPSMPIRIMRGLEKTGDIRPGEVITVVLDVENLDGVEVANSVLPMLSPAGSVAPLSKGRGLIVTDRLENIQRIRTLLATIGSEQPGNRMMKTYTLLHASGAIVSDLLNRTFGVATAPKRTSFNPNTKAMEVLPPDPNDYITSVYDEASRTLVLFGPPDRTALAEELISKFEDKDGAGGDVRIYYPQTIKADELANMIRQAIPGVAEPNESAATSATKARVIADVPQNRLIVAAPIGSQLDQIEQLITRVDKGVLGAGPGGPLAPLRSQTIQLTKIFRPRATEATNLAEIVKQALTRRNAGGQNITTASVSYDQPSQSVVVTGSPQDVQIASDIVSQLETGSTQPTPLLTRFIDVGSPEEAKRIQPLLEQLYLNQTADGGTGTLAHAKILADPDGGRLIITATAEHQTRIAELVKQLRADRLQDIQRHLKVIVLKNTRTDTALASIQSLVNDRMADRCFATLPKPSLVADAPNNRLLITATEEQLKEIEDVINIVDIVPASTERQLQVIPLQVKQAAEIIPLITQLVSQFATPGQIAPTLMADPTGKQLIVLASAKDQARIRTLAQQFDVTPATAAPRQFRGIELFSRTATEFTPFIQQLYQEQNRGQPEPAGGPATLLPDPRNNRIMVSGSEKEIARVEAIIRQLDPAGKGSTKVETRVVRLKTASATELAGLVEKSLNAQSQQVQVLLDGRSNSLIVTGDPAAVEAASQMIQQLDTRADAGASEMRILDLKSADAAATAGIVNNLFTEMIKDQHGSEYVSLTKIIPDTTANRLIVTGVSNEIEQVAGLVQKLDSPSDQAAGARVFKLNMSEAAMMAPIVSNAMLHYDLRGRAVPRVTVTADEKSNSLIVGGTRADLQEAASVIEKLDGGTNLTDRVLKIFQVKGDADTLSSLVQKVFAAQYPGHTGSSLPSITADPSGKRIFLFATPAVTTQIESLITALDDSAAQEQRDLHSIALTNVTAADVLPTVKQIYAEQAKDKTLKPAAIYTDASGNRLLVQGTQDQAAIIQQIVGTLEGQNRPAREITLFDLGKLAEVQRVMPLAQQLYKNQLANSGSQLGPPDAQFFSDNKTGRLFVSARADQLKTIATIITGLQLATTQPARETKVFEAGNSADLQRLLPLVQQLYKSQWKDKEEIDPADAEFMADPKTGHLIVSGKPEHLKQIEAILQQLGAGKAQSDNRTTQIMDLTTASAVELATTVRTLYLEEAKNRLGNQAPDTLITPDAGGNRLIIVGETNEVNAVEEIARKLDKVSAQSASARVFKIKSADPDKVAEILTASLVHYDAYGRPQKRATVSVDSKTRTLIVTGDPKELQGVSLIIEQLDQSLGEQPERKMKVVTLKQGKVASLSAKAREIYNDRIKTQPELGTTDLLMIDETDSNQLILAGNENQLKVINQIIDELQSAQLARSGRETKLLDVGPPDEMNRLLPLVQRLYKDRMGGRDASDPPDAQIIPDEKNGRFIVTARTNHIAEIEAILAQLRNGQSGVTGRDTRVYELTTATASDLSATVRTLYEEQAKARPGSAAADTLILPDSGANRIIVTGPTNELGIVEDIIKKLDKVGTQSASARVFKLKSADPEKVAEILGTALVRYDAYGRPQKRVSIVTDAKTATIIATGDPKELQSASVIIEQLDASLGEQPGRSMRVLAVKDRLASELSTKVRQVYQDRAQNEFDLGTSDPLILDDPTSNQIIIAGTDKQLAALDEIAQTLQKGGETAGRQMRVFPLERTSASSLVTMFSQIYAKQIGSTEPTERVAVSAGGNDRSLVVDAPGPTLNRIEELIKGLDMPGPEGQNVIETVRLTKSRAEEMAESVNHAITNRSSSTFGRRVNVTPVPGANSLLINGPTNAVQEVLRIIHDLDQDGHGAGDVEIRVYKLENGAAREVSVLLEQLLRSVTRNLARSSGESSQRPREATVTVDDRSNSLIISGTEAHFKVVEKILPTLDRAPERSDRDVQFVWLRKAKAFEVSTQLDALFEDRPRSDRPVIEPDFQANSLTIIAKRGDIAQIQDLVARLDEQGKSSSIQVRVRALDHVAAEQMAEMLKNIYPQTSGTPLRVMDKVAPNPGKQGSAPGTNAAPEVAVAIDKNANALILSGPAQELDNVDRLISDLSDNFYGNEAEFRLFSIQDADPVIVARTLMELMKQEAIIQPQRPGEPPQRVPVQPHITVVAEPRTRSVIVRARPTDFALMESLIKQLDKAGQIAQLEFRVVPVTNAPPEKVLPLVQQMVTQLNATRPGESVTVAVDTRSRGLVVIAREMTGDQVEKMIRSLDKPAETVEAEVRIISLKKANAAQVAVVLRNMLKPGDQGQITPEARELQEQVSRLKITNDNGGTVVLDLNKPIKIETDPASGTGGGNRLLLTSTPDNLRALATVVELMDSVPVTEGVEVRFVKLKYSEAAAVAQTLNLIFTQGKALAVGPGGPGAEPAGEGKALVGPLNVAIDARGNTIILSGKSESLDLALKVITGLDSDAGGFVTDVRLFRLKYTSATRLLPMLRAVFAEGPSVGGAEGLAEQVSRLRVLQANNTGKTNETLKPRAALTIQADDQVNLLIVAARADDLPLIQEVIEQLDIPAASGLENVHIYPVEHADPSALQKILTDLYTGPGSANLRAEDKPTFSVDARTGSLVVAGKEKAFTVIEALLKQLDQKLPFQLRDLALIPLEHADANVVGPTLQKLMDARVTQRASLTPNQADELKVIIIADQRSNALLVGGSREAFELVQNLARQLDQAAPAFSGRIRLIPMKFADARVIASTVGTLFEQRYAAIRTTDNQRMKPIILADPRSNSLLVAASQEDNAALDDLLQRMDAKTDNPAQTLTVLPLKHNDSAKVATTIESIFAARIRSQTLPGQTPLPSDQIKIEPDALNNALVVSASKENLELIQSLLEKLDQEPVVPDGVFETFTLEFADAQRIATILKSLVEQGLYRPGLPAGASGKPVSGRDVLSVSVDPRSNTLIVSASPENLAIIREVVKRIDNKDLAASADVRMYVLKKSRASTLATTLQQFFQAKQAADSVAANASTRLLPVSVIPYERVNAILVTGGKEAFGVVERLLPQLDGESVFTRINFRVFPLHHASALKLQTTLQPIFANRPPPVKGEPVDPVTVIADQWANALLVGASIEDMASVESLVARLDAEPTDKGMAIHVFPLAKAVAKDVATTVQSLFREGAQLDSKVPLTIAADERINALVVSCGETDAQHIAELVQKLDTSRVSKVSEIKIFPLQYAKAEILSTILNTALNTKPVGTAQLSPNAQSLLQFVTHSKDGKELITAALKEAVLITPDARMNSLLVSAPPEYMGLFEQIISQMDSGTPQKAKIRVFTLRNADARQMGQVLSQFFRMTQSAASGSNPGEHSIQYTLYRPTSDEDDSPDEPVASATLGTVEENALTVTIDSRTDSLLVGGTDQYVNLVAEIIESLDSTSANERTSEVIRLKNSQAVDVATAIRSFQDQERQKAILAVGADAAAGATRIFDQEEVAVVAEPTSNTLLLSASRHYFAQIRKIVEDIDRPQPQVLIQVLLAEVTLDDQTDLGVEWSITGKDGGKTYSMGTQLGVANDLTTLGGFSSAITGTDLNFLLRALKTENKLKVLSRPQIVTSDNQPATIDIGQQVPLVNSSRLDVQNNLTTSFTYQDVGVSLMVTPKINRDGFVQMTIQITNSDISTTTISVNNQTDSPVIDMRRANTTVTAQSGQTIVIGGLISTSDAKNTKKVPYLGDIPYLGAAFRSTSVIRTRQELLILLTPQVLANIQTPVPLENPNGITRKMLDESTFRNMKDDDKAQRRLLEPLFPTNTPPTNEIQTPSPLPQP